MSSEKFIKNKTALITLIAACVVVLISLGVRQTFGMFYFDFSTDLGYLINSIWICNRYSNVFVGL